jgi:hypothetical protein
MAMSTVTLELDQDVVAIREQQHQPIGEAARQMIVFELYRRGSPIEWQRFTALGSDTL